MSDKFAIGSLGIGPFSGMLDSMEFVKQAWSTLNLPNNLTPTMDLDEIDRRIADLKVVEQWLTMNLGMLRSSIQGMEIQRGTIAAFGEMQRAAAAAAAAGAEANAAHHSAQAPSQAREPVSAKASAAADPGSPGTPESLANELSRAAVEAVNPTAWWKLLQSQFGQIAQAALANAGRSDWAAVSKPPRAGPATGPRARRAKDAGVGAPRSAPTSVVSKPGSKTGARKAVGAKSKAGGANRPPVAHGPASSRPPAPQGHGAGNPRKAKGKG